ncbi:hypothetical protein PRIPAC_79090 [Pristionchus pacificus]|uniref:Dehydrogenase n=1 Tax=Pristionchus pacificus TaxID=54126 RepID=A0A2A6CNX3_PRIPA|nr:hypothetical protein PRIPAC_79090 [Pristionchus pacificus]|eukprot:PDM79777.1 dehydrogenase [Pristionchus pacificus]
MVKNIVLTGGNRGIGLGLVKELLKNDKVDKLFATTRDAAKSPELQSISDPRLVIVEMNADCDSSIAKAVEQIGKSVGASGVDILINNAGVLYAVDINAPIDRKGAAKNFEVNCVATMAVTFAFKDLLKAAAKASGSAQVVNISSELGSISLTWGPCAPRHFTAYSMSKAALNMYTKTISMDWKADGIRATSVHPGWVKTDMGTDAADLTVEESTSNMADMICKFGEANNGLFYNWKFEPLTW